MKRAKAIGVLFVAAATFGAAPAAVAYDGVMEEGGENPAEGVTGLVDSLPVDPGKGKSMEEGGENPAEGVTGLVDSLPVDPGKGK